MIAPLIVLGAPAIASLLMQYVVIPLTCLWLGPGSGWNAKAKEWRDAIIGVTILVYFGAVVWFMVADALKQPFVLGHRHLKNAWCASCE